MSNSENDQIVETAGERMADLMLRYQVALDMGDLETIAMISNWLYTVLGLLQE